MISHAKKNKTILALWYKRQKYKYETKLRNEYIGNDAIDRSEHLEVI